MPPTDLISEAIRDVEQTVTCCAGRGIVLDIHKTLSKKARRPGKAYYRGEALCGI